MGEPKHRNGKDFEDLELLQKMSKNPISKAMDKIFLDNFSPVSDQLSEFGTELENNEQNGEDMTNKDQGLSLNIDELEISELSNNEESGIDINLDADDSEKKQQEIQAKEPSGLSQIYIIKEEGTDSSFELGDDELEEEATDEELVDLEDPEDLQLVDSVDQSLSLSDEEAIEKTSVTIVEYGQKVSDLPENKLPENAAEDDIDALILKLRSEEDASPQENPVLEEIEKEVPKLEIESLQENNIDLGVLELSDTPAVDDMVIEASLELSAVEPNSVVEDLQIGNDIEFNQDGEDLSQEAQEKLQEIDQIMGVEANNNDLDLNSVGFNVEESLETEESPSTNFTDSAEGSNEEQATGAKLIDEKKENLESAIVLKTQDKVESVDFQKLGSSDKLKEMVSESNHNLSESSRISSNIREISGAYASELEKNQAIISNLRSDREELLKKIQQLEDDKTLSSRQMLSLRAELDEKKIELTIIRKKLNEEILNLKDSIKIFEEKTLILEEKNKALYMEIDKLSQKNRIDFKRVQLRERELEQQLELLKSDAAIQIKNRDLKIIELKRKIDSMEFDMESISQQEKKSIESKFELEDKLDRAIKTLRSAINLLEDDSEKNRISEVLKKNIDA